MSKRKRRSIIKNVIFLLIIAAIVAIVYVYITDIEEKEFIQDAETISKPYQYLENRDTTKYVANLLIDGRTSMVQLSKNFYGDEMFWFYIFQENSDVENILNIPTGTIIKIPKIKANLLNVKSAENVRRVKNLSDSILNDVNEQKKLRTKTMVFDF